MTDAQLDDLAAVALARDFEPVEWDAAPSWRRIVMQDVVRAALSASGLTRAHHARSAWLASMTRLGWRWGRSFSEKERTHPGVVDGDLTTGGAIHWCALVDAVHARARTIGVEVLG